MSFTTLTSAVSVPGLFSYSENSHRGTLYHLLNMVVLASSTQLGVPVGHCRHFKADWIEETNMKLKILTSTLSNMWAVLKSHACARKHTFNEALPNLPKRVVKCPTRFLSVKLVNGYQKHWVKVKHLVGHSAKY